MCGIAGIFRLGHSEFTLHDQHCLQEMVDTMVHRGPDAQRTIVKDHCGLGAVRLSIQDLSEAGLQPMGSEDEDIWVVYNGEIYNFIELRHELSLRGYHFRSGCDTEVLLNAYRAWEEECVKHFIGMWSFALYDRRKKQLFLSRDRLGIKPLYYIHTDTALVFASEIKTLLPFLRANNLPIRPHMASLVAYMENACTDEWEETLFEGIYHFPAATTQIWTREGVTTFPYWSLRGATEARARTLSQSPKHEVIADLQHLLADAVRIHLRGDVPAGICLSGGLDSSTIVSLAANYAEKLRTYSIQFEETKYDESPYIRQVVDAFPVTQAFCQARPEALLSTLGDIIWHLDEPSVSPAVYSHWNVVKLASQDVRVVLSGQGGDEIFGGYTAYYPPHLYYLFKAGDVAGLLREISGIANMYGPAYAWHMIRKVTSSGHPSSVSGERLVLQELCKQVERVSNDWRLWPTHLSDPLNNVLYWEICAYRLPRLLRYEDRISMAFSLESRVPLLDHRVVELSLALSGAWKIHRGWSKWALRQAMQYHLPKGIVWRRRKQGFPSPFAHWLRQDLLKGVRDILFAPQAQTRSLLASSALERMLVRHIQGAEDNAAFIWRALSLELWLRQFQLSL